MKRLVALAGVIVVLVCVSSASGAPKPVWTVSPKNVNFGTVAAAGQTFKSVIVTYTGSGGMVTAGAGSGDTADFTVLASSTCQGQVLLPGLSCTIDFAFSPQGAGRFNATFPINLSSGTGSSHIDVSLSGRGT
jgi:hypothetical protein